MPKPDEYLYIRAWGAMLGSYEYYIQGEQYKAAMDNAPLEAIYFDSDKMCWSIFDEIKSQDTRDFVKRRVDALRRGRSH